MSQRETITEIIDDFSRYSNDLSIWVWDGRLEEEE